MALFGKKSTPEVDSRIAFAALLPPPTDRALSWNIKQINDHVALLVSLVAREQLLSVVSTESVFGSGILAVTDERVLQVAKQKLVRSFPFPEISKTRMGATANGLTLVEIFSHSYELDYRPNDPERIREQIYAQVRTPRMGQTINDMVTARLG